MTIFGRVLCPLQPSCLPPPHAARALLLSSFPCLVYSRFSCFLFLLCHQNRTLFTSLLVSLSSHFVPYHSFPLLLFPLILLLLFCLFSPNQLLPLILLLPASPLFTASFVLSLLPLFLIFPLSFPNRKLYTSRFTPLAVYREPGLLASGLFWLHPCVPNQPCCMTHTCSQIH